MRIHEFQAKALFAEYGIPVAPSRPAATPDEADAAARALGLPVVLKAQIHAGGRGKGGGIRRIDDPAGVAPAAAEMLGRPLVTPQTGPEGQVVRTLLVERATPIERELYLGMTIDRVRRRVAVMGSRAGGVEIEETAKADPSAIATERVEPAVGLRPFQAFRLARRMGLSGTNARATAKIILALYQLFCEKDCSLAEINPLVIDPTGAPVALDAKMNFDDNALFRRPEIFHLRDIAEEDPLEVEAKSVNLNYIKLDGNVGCLVNGAGLAMATMDLIQLAGARPANFLDVGGGATAEMIAKGFELLIGDPNVRAVFINIFGGILRCDVLARGVVAAARTVDLGVPVIVRLEGTNVEAGREILRGSEIPLRTAGTLEEAAALVAAAIGEGE